MKTLAFIAAVALAPVCLAQPYEISWYTIDSGGGTSTGGIYSLSSTIGQPDAGAPMSGGIYSLQGGFWVGGAPSCPADFNGDGFVDGFDYDDFVACFEGDPCPPGKDSDFNGDGFPDGFDYDDFVAAFEAGCV